MVINAGRKHQIKKFNVSAKKKLALLICTLVALAFFISSPGSIIASHIPLPDAPTFPIATDGTLADQIEVSWLPAINADHYHVYKDGVAGVGTLMYNANGAYFTDAVTDQNTHTYYIYSANSEDQNNATYVSDTGFAIPAANQATWTTKGDFENNASTTGTTTNSSLIQISGLSPIDDAAIKLNYGLANNPTIATGWYESVGLKQDGTVTSNRNDTSAWTNIKAVSAGRFHTVGLRANGTVEAVGSNVGTWTNIKAIAAGSENTIGLKVDGTVVGTGEWVGDLNTWTNVRTIAAGWYHQIGLKEDGTVVAAGLNRGQLAVGGWTNIKAIAGGRYHTVGLREDGTVVAVGDNYFGQLNVSPWTDIKAIAAGGGNTIGLKEDGTVVAVGDNDDGGLNIGSWSNIQAIAAGGGYPFGNGHTIGLKADGTVIGVGVGQGDVSTFNNIRFPSTTPSYFSPGTISGLKINSGQNYLNNWANISWNGSTPANTSLKFRTRGAATEASLSSAIWSDYYTSSLSAITAPTSRWLEVEATLESSDGVNTPQINDLSVSYTPLEIPSAPTMGSALALSSNSIMWNYVDNSSNEDGFRLQDSANNILASAAPNTSSITETNLFPNTTYTRHLHAYNAAGESIASFDVNKTTLSDAPSLPVATDGGRPDQIEVSWLPSLNADHYHVYKDGPAGVGTLVYNAGGLSFINPVTDQNTHTYYVYSANSADENSATYISDTGFAIPAGNQATWTTKGDFENNASTTGAATNPYLVQINGVLSADDTDTMLLSGPTYNSTIATGDQHTVGIEENGTIAATGRNDYGQINTQNWTNIKALSAGINYTIGLRENGTVVSVGGNQSGQLNIGNWTNIRSIATGGRGIQGQTTLICFTLGLKQDGTVVAVGDNTYGQRNVSNWSNIKAIAAGANHSVGLKRDGTVIAVGDNSYGQLNVEGWTNIKIIAAGDYHTVGVKEDGTVLATGGNNYGQINTETWTNIKAVAAGEYHTLGLKEDGTVVAVGNNGAGQLNVGSWTNIRSIATGGHTGLLQWVGTPMSIGHTVGLKEDRTVVAVGDNYYGAINIGGWNNIKLPTTMPSYFSGAISGLKIYAGQDYINNWANISWNSSIPANTALKFKTRGANTEASLSTATWSDYYTSSLSPITTPSSRWLEVEATLESSDGINTPQLNDLSVSFTSIEVPAAPTIGTAQALSPNSIQWNYIDNSTIEDSFKLHDSAHNELGSAAANTTSITETGLLPNTTYTRHIHANNADIESAPSADASKTTLSDAPIILGATDSTLNNQIGVYWLASPNADHYHVYKDGPAGTGTLVYNSTGTSFTDAVTDQNNHTYYVYSANTADENSATYASDTGRIANPFAPVWTTKGDFENNDSTTATPTTRSNVTVTGDNDPGDPFNNDSISLANDPASWEAISKTNSPKGRIENSVVWANDKLISWGGQVTWSGSSFNTGGIYSPSTNTWQATSTLNAPSARKGHTAIWTGSKMIVWGGYTNTGGIYDPVSDTWTATSTVNAPSGSAGAGHTAVWTGSKMIVWGGYTSGGYTNTRGIYDPATDTWQATSTLNAPSARSSHTAVWTGSKMIVWGGYSIINNTAIYNQVGGIYDPATDTWQATSTLNAPSARSSHTAVWTGSKMIVWGGNSNTGGIYDPASDTWTATSTVNTPSAGLYTTAVWTGLKMIVWSGDNTSGGIYDLEKDSWESTMNIGAPSGIWKPSSVWTGSKMLIWGGMNASNWVGDWDGGLAPIYAANTFSQKYYSPGTIRGLKFTTGSVGIKGRWSTISWNSKPLPANTSVRFRARTSVDNVSWSNWSNYVNQLAAGSTFNSNSLSSLNLADSQWLELELTLTSTADYSERPTLDGFSITYDPIYTSEKPTMGIPEAVSDSSIRWNFTDNSSIEDGFKLHDSNHNTIATVAADSNSINETGLLPNTTHTRHVHAFNADGDSEGSLEATETTLAVAPTNVVASDGTLNNQIDVSWTPSVGAEHYHVYRDGPAGTGTLVYNWINNNFTDIVSDTNSHTYYVYGVNSKDKNSAGNIFDTGFANAVPNQNTTIYGNSDDDLYIPDNGTTKYMTVDYLQGSSFGRDRSYIRFPISVLLNQSAGIISARLYFKEHPTLTSSIYTCCTTTADVFQINPFDPNASAGTIYGTSTISSAISLGSTANTYNNINVTSYLQADVDAQRSYSNWMLTSPSGVTRVLYYASNDYPGTDSDPYLQVEYGLRYPQINSLISNGGGQLTVNFTDKSIGEDDFHFNIGTNPNPEITDIQENVTSTSSQTTGNVYQETISGLEPDKQYYISMRSHGHSTGLISNYSNQSSAYTLPYTPLAPIVNATGDNVLKVAIDQNDANPPRVRYAIFNATLGKYLDTDGSLTDTPVYIPAINWTLLGTNTGLDPDTAYTFQARAITEDNEGVTPLGNTSAPVRTLASKPVAASAIGTDDGSGYKIKVSWNSGGSQNAFRVYSSSDNFTNVKYEGPLAQFEETGLNPNIVYDYQIYALNADTVINPDYTTTSSQLSSLPLMAPNLLSLSANSETELSASFIDTSTTEDDFHFYINTASPAQTDDRQPQLTQSKETVGSLDTKTLSNLAPNTRYFVRARAHNHATNTFSPYSQEQALSTLAEKPVQPKAEAVGSDKLKIIIDPGNNPPATKYAVYSNDFNGYLQSNGSISQIPFYQTISQWENLDGAIHSGLNANSAYSYKVKAKNGDGIETAFSLNSVPRYTWTKKPVISTIGGFGYEGLYFDIFWQGTLGDNYEIERKYNTYLVPSLSTAELIYKGDATYFRNIIPTGGIFDLNKYFYLAYGINKDGVKNPSPGFTYAGYGNTIYCAFGMCERAVTDLQATPVSSSQIDLSWNPSPDPVSGYAIYRNGEPIANVTSTTFSYSDTGLSENTSYTYYIKSAGYYPVISNIATATTDALAPQDPRSVNMYAARMGTFDYNNGTNTLSYAPDILNTGTDFREFDIDPYSPNVLFRNPPLYMQNAHYLRSFMQFPLENVSNSVNSATLYLNYNGTLKDLSGPTVIPGNSLSASVDNIADFGDFDASDWDINEYFSNIQPVNWLNETTTPQILTLDVTAQVKADVAAGRQFSSLRIKGLPEDIANDTFFSFSSTGTNRPRLIVNYNLTSDAPVLSSFSAGSPSQLSLNTEDKSTDEDDFHYYISTSPQPTADDTEPIASTSKSTTGTVYSKIFGNLNANTKYYIRSKAHNHTTDTYGNYSNELAGYTQATIPAAPTLEALSDKEVKVIIDSAGNPADTKYAIFNETAGKYLQADGSFGLSPVFKDYNYWGAILGFVNKGLEPETTYTYKVKAINNDGVETVFGSGSTITTASSQVPAPTRPQMLMPTEVTSDSITWNWRDNSSNEDSFVLHDENEQVIATLDSNVTSYTESNLQPDTQYKRHIHAYNNTAGSSQPSDEEVVRTLLLGPTNLNAKAEASPSTSVNITWDAPISWTPVSYKIYRLNQKITRDNINQAQVVAQVNQTTHTDSGTGGEVYYYQITAIHSDDRESDLSTDIVSDRANIGKPSPHGKYSQDTAMCANCHRGHTGIAKALIAKNNEQICFTCHDGTGSVYNIATTYPGTAAHDVKLSLPPTSDVKCTYCHDPHGTDVSWALKYAEEALCFTCHNSASMPNTMNNWDIQAQFNSVSRHAINGTTADGLSGAKVECNSCHGPHTVQATDGKKLSNPDNTMALWSGSKNDFCLKCHDESAPLESLLSSLFVPYTIRFPETGTNNFFPGWNKAPFKQGGHVTTGMQCTQCHQPHGSNNPRLVAFNNNDSPEVSKEEKLCLQCHGLGGTNTSIYSVSQTGQWGSTSLNSADLTKLRMTYGTQSFFKFDISSLSTQTVVGAKLKLFVSDYYCLAVWESPGFWNTYLTMKLFQISDYATLDTGDFAWEDGYNYNQFANCTTPKNSYTTVDITSKVQEAIANSNNFIAFKTVADTPSYTGDFVELAPPTATNDATSPKIELVFDNSSKFNFNDALSKPYKHPIDTISDKHKDTEDAANLGGANRHAECYDCHNPHESSPTPVKSQELAPKASGALKGTIGVAPINGKAGDPLSFIIKPVENEYELCFRCHSSFVSLPPDKPSIASWSSTNVFGLNTQDKAKEFNPNNPSFHPVEAAGKNLGIKDETFVEGTPWNPTAGDDANYSKASPKVYCTDCHGSSSTALPAGPHGSSQAAILKGDFTSTLYTDFICYRCHKKSVYYNGNNNKDGLGIEGGSRYKHTMMGGMGTNICMYCHAVHGSTENEHLIRMPYKHIEPGEDPAMPNGGGIFLAYNNYDACDMCHRDLNELGFPRKYEAAYK